MRHLAIPLFASTLAAQSVTGSVHIASARFEAFDSKAIGLAGHWAFARKHALSLQIDRAVGSIQSSSSWKQGESFQSLALDWTWYSRGVRTTGLFLGTGYATSRSTWRERDGSSAGAWLHREENASGPDFHIGLGIAAHLRLEGRIQFTFPSPSLLGSIGWQF